MEKLRSIYASAYAAAVSIVVTVIVTIRMEFSADFKKWLASFTGHHWVTKSWLSLIVFALCYVLFRYLKKNPDASATRKALTTLLIVVISGFVVLLGFFLFEYFE